MYPAQLWALGLRSPVYVDPDSCVQFPFIVFGANYVPVDGLFHVWPKKLEYA